VRAGRAIRHDRQLAATAAALCDCGHPVGGHRELPPAARGYLPLHFHCAECECVVDAGDQ
jgi:hypothetical protein